MTITAQDFFDAQKHPAGGAETVEKLSGFFRQKDCSLLRA